MRKYENSKRIYFYQIIYLGINRVKFYSNYVSIESGSSLRRSSGVQGHLFWRPKPFNLESLNIEKKINCSFHRHRILLVPAGKLTPRITFKNLLKHCPAHPLFGVKGILSLSPCIEKAPNLKINCSFHRHRI